MDNLIFDRTLEDVENKNSKGVFNYNDMNRIENWISVLSTYLNEDGYNINVTCKTNWDFNKLATASDYKRVKNNIREILDKFKYITNISNAYNYLDYKIINSWEKNLYEVNNMTIGMENYYIRCGVATMGDNRLFQNKFRRYRR